MKQFRKILTLLLIVLVVASTFDADAQTRRKRSNKRNTTSITKVTPNDLVESLSREAVILSRQCPIDYNELGRLESVSFRNKQMTITMSFKEGFMENYYSPNTDFSYMEYGFKLILANIIKSSGVPLSTFAQSGISFKIILKDSDGNFLWQNVITCKEGAEFYRQTVKNGNMPKNNKKYNLEYFRQLVKSLNKSTPQYLEDDMVITSITMEGSKIFYNTKVPSYMVVGFMMLTEDEKEETRREIAEEFYDYFSKIDTRQKNSIINEMISLGISINYRYYVDDITAPVYTVSLPSSYIKKNGTNNY